LDGLGKGGSGGVDPEAFAQFFEASFGFGFDFGDSPGDNSDESIIPLEVTLDDLYNGKTIKMTLEREVICETCKGSGLRGASSKPHKCTKCSGNGWFYGATHVAQNGYGRSRQKCNECDGQGHIIREKNRCKRCKGSQTVTEKMRQEVVIEPGMDDGAKIVLKGEGDQKPNRPPGDVIFTLQVLPHQSFERSAKNLMTTVHLTLSEALLGFSRVVISHLDGRGIKVSSPKGKIVKAGDTIVFRGEGMPVYGQHDKRGDLYIIFQIEMPTESWLATVDQEALERLLPPKKPSTIAGAAVVDEGLFEMADITEFGENEEDWIDDEEEDQTECLHQ